MTESAKGMFAPPKNKRKMIIWGIIAIAAICAVAGWVAIKASDFNPDLVSGNGRIEATEIDIATKLGGRVINIMANEGDFVKAGQPLAQMQIDVLEAQRNEARAQLARAVSVVAGAEAQVSARRSDMSAAQAMVMQRESELDAVQRRFARSKALVEEHVIAIQAFDDVNAELHGKLAAVNSGQSQVAAARAAIKAAEAQVVNAKSGVAAAEATIARIEADIEDSQLKSPRDGRVQYRVAQPGEVLGAGGKVLSLVDLGDVYMTFFLPETMVGRVSLGSEVRIVLDAAPQFVFPAKVSYVASVAQFTPKTVETASERQKLMFRVKARIAPELLQENLAKVKTGLPGVAWLKLNSQDTWPANLEIKVAK